MTKTNVTKALSLILCTVLIAAMALFTTGCSDNTQNNETTEAQTVQGGEENAPGEAVTVLGEGQSVFTFTVTDKGGNETAFEIHTDKTIVGEALQELGLIAGDMGDYGLYVKTVNGITLDYDKDGVYWAFYIDGEYAMSGVDTTEIVAGSGYAFKAEKG
ncbi:MAG: DUF4430 domain-containing protein [Lachnospiraceae bacterium]|nr:DUF4430 domain-containing protein [Lachnospiraceae bacterium]